MTGSGDAALRYDYGPEARGRVERTAELPAIVDRTTVPTLLKAPFVEDVRTRGGHDKIVYGALFGHLRRTFETTAGPAHASGAFPVRHPGGSAGLPPARAMAQH